MQSHSAPSCDEGANTSAFEMLGRPAIQASSAPRRTRAEVGLWYFLLNFFIDFSAMTFHMRDFADWPSHFFPSGHEHNAIPIIERSTFGVRLFRNVPMSTESPLLFGKTDQQPTFESSCVVVVFH